MAGATGSTFVASATRRAARCTAAATSPEGPKGWRGPASPASCDGHAAEADARPSEAAQAPLAEPVPELFQLLVGMVKAMAMQAGPGALVTGAGRWTEPAWPSAETLEIKVSDHQGAELGRRWHMMRRPTHTMAGQRQGSKEGEAAQQEIVQEKARTDEGEAAISRRFAAEEEVDWRCTPQLGGRSRLGTTDARTALAASGCGGGGGQAGHDRCQNCTRC